jgi:predicted DNA binding CopG/RHH family protein
MRKKQQIPKFRSEAEEAKWWYDNRHKTAKIMEEAVSNGRTTTLSRILDRARKKSGSTPTVSIRIDPEDLSRARQLAEEKGLRYQTYLKMLLHQALDREGKRRSG